MGRTVRAMVDRVQDDGMVQARTIWQADDIDGVTWLDADAALPGTLVDVGDRRRGRLRLPRQGRRHRGAVADARARQAARPAAGRHDDRELRAVSGHSRSAELMRRSREIFPGGVNSPVRAFGGVGGTPIVAERGEGCRLFDVDGNEYIDFVLSWGPLVLGHAPPAVLDALDEAMQRGTSFGMPTALELRLGELIRERMPHMERLRFVSSGTEATMSAVRVARAHTGRDGILKFDGCYHGHGDSFLVKAGSGVATLGLPNSPGVPAALAELTYVAPYNDVPAVERLVAEQRDRIAAIIVEPVVGNAGFIPPDPAFPAGTAPRGRRGRRGADLRRGHDRVPHRPGGCARAVRRAPRSDHAGQGDRRRAARGGLRRAAPI